MDDKTDKTDPETRIFAPTNPDDICPRCGCSETIQKLWCKICAECRIVIH